MRRQTELFLERSMQTPRVDLPLADAEQHLVLMQKLHQDLQQLSDILSPPYLEDSLPMAISTLVKAWQVQHPIAQIDLKLPSQWVKEPLELSRVVLITIDEFLKITASEPQSSTIVIVSLAQVAHWGELSFQVIYPNLGESVAKYCSSGTTFRSHHEELKALQQAFRLLTQGECSRRQQSKTLLCNFRWRCAEAIENVD